MKKIFALAAILCCSIVSFGQNKGDLGLTANLNLGLYKTTYAGDYSSKQTAFGIGAGAQYFVIDNLAVGVSLDFDATSYGDDDKSHSFYISPYVAYYLGITGNFYYRPTISYSLGMHKVKNPVNEMSYNGNTFNIGLGVFEYRMRDHFAITANVLNLAFYNENNSEMKTTYLNLQYPTLGVIYYF